MVESTSSVKGALVECNLRGFAAVAAVSALGEVCCRGAHGGDLLLPLLRIAWREHARSLAHGGEDSPGPVLWLTDGLCRGRGCTALCPDPGSSAASASPGCFLAPRLILRAGC